VNNTRLDTNPEQSEVDVCCESDTPQPIAIREELPVTWIWDDMDDIECDGVKFTKQVPHTVTSWYISAFALNKANGLGFGESSTLTVFKPFFVSTTLPYSVKRGEILIISVQIFNYLSIDQEVTVVVTNEGQNFDFTDDVDPNFRELFLKQSLISYVTAPEINS
jgi:Alpha-2-macroglobulin family